MTYEEGQRIELIAMGMDEPDPIPPGSKGTIIMVSDTSAFNSPGIGGRRISSVQLVVEWDPGVNRTLNLEVPPDIVRVIG